MASSETRTCPCKKLPLCLSSFTAAEYGDLHTLSKLGPSVADRRDYAGYTPLHLAAQNGHVAATSLLIQMGCSPNGGGGNTTTNSTTTTAATPLHRAAFSGAIATMRILLQSPECDLMARDTSFGDEMTPLHKAAAGGRYLAVQLLLEALRYRGDKQLRWLSLALQARDKSNRTPLKVAEELRQRQDEERQAVARWDEVAGGVADWDKCVELLLLRTTTAEQQQEQEDGQGGKSSKQQLLYPPLPTHLTTRDGCIDCDSDATTTSGGVCLTASWQAAFQAALGNSVDLSLQNRKQQQQQTLESKDSRQQQQQTGQQKTIVDQDSANHDHQQQQQVPDDSKPPSKTVPEASSSGVSCSVCGTISIALYPATGGRLVCKACKRSAAR